MKAIFAFWIKLCRKYQYCLNSLFPITKLKRTKQTQENLFLDIFTHFKLEIVLFYWQIGSAHFKQLFLESSKIVQFEMSGK